LRLHQHDSHSREDAEQYGAIFREQAQKGDGLCHGVCVQSVLGKLALVDISACAVELSGR
jgi:hypothetical protein